MTDIKISIITTCFNSDKTIAYSLSSVHNQTYMNIEHVLVDGGSQDDTIKILEEYKNKNKNKEIKIIKNKKLSIYDGINLGIKISRGQYILVLNSDDILHDKNTINQLIKVIEKNYSEIYFGNVVYFNDNRFNNISRYYTSKTFKPWMMYLGLMPPHPGALIESKLAKKNIYNDEYKIAADFDLLFRLLQINKNEYEKIDLIVTRMRTGGISGRNLMAHYISSKEIYKSIKSKKKIASHILINLRYIPKLMQFVFFKFKDLNSFVIRKDYQALLRYDFKLITNIKKLNFQKNFVLSALNLAFLGSYIENKVKLYKNLIHWPDGIFVKNLSSDANKIPGREIVRNIKIAKNINKITVLGSLPAQSLKYLNKRFKNKIIINIDLPYGPIEKIIKKFNYRINKDELIFITLPTPKQEQLSEYLIKENKYYKIICIGGSINMLSGVERQVPDLFINIEFVWRLRYETRRRLKRLIVTFFQYLKGKYIIRKLNNLTIKII